MILPIITSVLSKLHNLVTTSNDYFSKIHKTWLTSQNYLMLLFPLLFSARACFFHFLRLEAWATLNIWCWKTANAIEHEPKQIERMQRKKVCNDHGIWGKYYSFDSRFTIPLFRLGENMKKFLNNRGRMQKNSSNGTDVQENSTILLWNKGDEFFFFS